VKSGGAATGKLYLQTEVITTVLPSSLANGKADNQILRSSCTCRPASEAAREPGQRGASIWDQGARAGDRCRGHK
jgi:hypothetical protein